tara:strand:- start:2183 stop:3199 length:1017 start_codon:yes stop_codon:yes gene_type:complete
MPTALDSLVLFIAIIIPGITFRRFYFQGEFTKQFNSRSLTHGLIASILPGILLQVATVFIYKNQSYLNSYNLITTYNSFKGNSIPTNLFDENVLLDITSYLFILLSLSVLVANLSYRLVRISKADRWSTVMRFSNSWNYYFKGEVKDFPEYKSIVKGKILEVRADILLRVANEEPRLYAGIVSQHTLQKETLELKNIYLTKVFLYKRKNENEKRIPIRIPGDVMILNANDIININLRYVTIPKKSYKGLPGLTLVLFFLGLIFVVMTDVEIFNGSTLFKTILIKIYAVIYLLFISTLLETFISKKSSEANKRSIIQGLSFFIFVMTILFLLFRRNLLF